MKKSMAMLMFVLACCLSAAAQSDMSGDAMKKDKMKDGSGKTMSMTGCISEKDGKYMMMNKQHPDGVQLMSSDDLKPHVGHKVKVTGMMEKMDNDSMKSDDKMKHDNMGMMSMKVNSMKMMSEHCDMSKMMK